MTSRERLVEAAAELLQREGYTGMSPAAIQARAGVGQGSMYHHFAGKAELAAAAAEHNAERLIAAADDALASPGDPVERVCNYLLRTREPMGGCPVGRIVQDRGIAEDAALSEVVRSLFAGLQAQIAAVLAEEPSITNPDELAATVLAVVQGGYVLARARGGREPFDDAVAGAAALLRGAR